MTTLEQENVYKVYSCIAEHFSDTRINQWQWITDFINVTAKPNKRILDIGCGNGRNMEGYDKTQVFGIDTCPEFVEICKERGYNVLVANMCSLPYPDNYFDHILCIASFHHLSTEDHRLQALREMRRVMKPEGSMLLSVWSIRQPPKSKQQFTKFGDTLVSWNKFGETYERYYYIFEDEELYNLFWKSGWKLGSHVWDHGNEIFTVIAR
jgi:tRNA (uracil-5-)-methyltransferase TRM9